MAANTKVRTIDSSMDVVFIAAGRVSVSVVEQVSDYFPVYMDYPRLH